MKYLLLHGDCLTELSGLPDASVDSVVTDPPYGLSNTKPAQVAETITRWASGERDYLPGGRGFMGNEWDGFVPPPAVWDECLRVLKPGGHMLVFAGPRTQDLMGLSIRLAGFDIRDSVAWLYGTGFPKADSVLKPAHEPIIMARKPFSGSAKANVAKHGTGGLNIDACRIGDEVRINPPAGNKPGGAALNMSVHGMPQDAEGKPAVGRWPSNVVLDEDTAEIVDAQSGYSKSPDVGSVSNNKPRHSPSMSGGFKHLEPMPNGYGDEGGASRFFYTSKASPTERPKVDGVAHPTVKPLALMRWLLRLVTPEGGVTLDPFAGSGATLEAALQEGMVPIGIERENDYIPLIESRIARTLKETS